MLERRGELVVQLSFNDFTTLTAYTQCSARVFYYPCGPLCVCVFPLNVFQLIVPPSRLNSSQQQQQHSKPWEKQITEKTPVQVQFCLLLLLMVGDFVRVRVVIKSVSKRPCLAFIFSRREEWAGLAAIARRAKQDGSHHCRIVFPFSFLGPTHTLREREIIYDRVDCSFSPPLSFHSFKQRNSKYCAPSSAILIRFDFFLVSFFLLSHGIWLGCVGSSLLLPLRE